MATISKYRNKWKCQVRKHGFPSRTKTFTTRADALRWGREIESDMDRGIFVRNRETERLTLADLVDRYTTEVSPTKRSGNSDFGRARTVKKHLGSYSLAALTPAVLAEYRNARIKVVSAQTVIHELNLVSRTLRHAVSEWDIALPAGIPTAMIKKPSRPAGRNRRVTEGELEAIKAATNSDELRVVVGIAVETAMRRGELAGLRWENIDLQYRTAHIPQTKTDTPRTVPLSTIAVGLLRRRGLKESGPVFSITDESISQAFERAVARARKQYVENGGTNPTHLTNLRFHDLRHEATSRLFERGLGMMEVAAITGHKTLAMLQRYTHLRAEDLAKKLG